MHEDTWIKAALGAIGGAFAYVYGPLDTLLVILLCFVAIDYVTGVMSAFVCRQLSSAVGFRGLLKKLMVFALVAVATLLDRCLPDMHGALRAAVCLFYIANEGISILENAHRMGIPIPKALRTALKKLSEEKEIK